MIMQIVKLKSELDDAELERVARERLPHFEAIHGLVQKYYVRREGKGAFAGVYLWRKLRIMAKSQLFGPPVLTWILFHGGIFPVRRGVRDEEAFETVRTIFAQGGSVMVYAEGGRSRTRELGEPRPGVGRMALESGIPVVPVAIYGSAGVRGWKRFRFPAVTIRYGEPLTFPVEEDSDRDRQLEVANEIFDQVKEMYADFERLGRKGSLAAAKSA